MELCVSGARRCMYSVYYTYWVFFYGNSIEQRVVLEIDNIIVSAAMLCFSYCWQVCCYVANLSCCYKLFNNCLQFLVVCEHFLFFSAPTIETCALPLVPLFFLLEAQRQLCSYMAVSMVCWNEALLSTESQQFKSRLKSFATQGLSMCDFISHAPTQMISI